MPRVRIATAFQLSLAVGGLLIALPPGDAGRLEALCRDAGQPMWRVGEAFEGEGIEVL